jgi:hypothetical protein
MNNNFTLPISDELDEYPEVSPTDLERAIHRRNFVEIHKQSVNLMLDSDIIAWFKKNQVEKNTSRLLIKP